MDLPPPKPLTDREVDQIHGEKTSDLVLWFGQYRGYMVKEVPSDYLRWLLDCEPPEGDVRHRWKNLQSLLERYLTEIPF